MRSVLRPSGIAMALGVLVAGVPLVGARPARAQPHDHANDRAGQVEQLQRMILPPSEWQMDANLSADRARALSTYPHFGGLHTLASAEVWVPNNPGMVLVVSRVVATNVTNATEANLDAAVRAATQEFENSVAATLDVRGQAMPPGGRKFVHADTATEIRIEIAQVTLGYQARLVIARDAQRLESVTTECMWADSEPAGETSDAAAACRAALASTNATIVLRKRLPLAMPAAGGSGAEVTIAGNDSANSSDNSIRQPSASLMSAGPRTSLSDDGKIVFPPMRLAPPAAPFNWQPWLFGLGTVIVLIALWLNNRHRRHLEALDGRPIRKPRGKKLAPPDAPPGVAPADCDAVTNLAAPAVTNVAASADLADPPPLPLAPRGQTHE